MQPDTLLLLAKADPVLEKIIRQIPYPDFVSTHHVFHDLLSCIIEQQIHYRSTKKIFSNMLSSAGINLLSPENFQQFEEKALPEYPLASEKYETIARLIDFWESHHIDWINTDDQTVRHTLSAIKGIGQWSIDMILLFTLKRPSVFPHDDYHLKQIMTSLYGLNPTSKLKAQMLSIAEAWRPHQSTAVLYLLEWKRRHKSTAPL
jgi:DNA-3-methyladenine glycosylase II